MQKFSSIVPEWAYKMDVHKSVEYFDDEYADSMNVPSFTLPSVSQQWKDDMTRRIKAMKRWGKTSDDFRWRAPKEFINTGRWPKNVKRPVTKTVSQLEKEKDI